MMETPSSSFTTPTTTTKTTPFTHYFKTRLDQITTLTQDSCLPSLSVEGLVDTLFAIYTDCKSLSTQSPQVTAFVQKCKANHNYTHTERGRKRDCVCVSESSDSALFLKTILDDKIVTKIQALRVNTQDFEVVQTLATGAVGKVSSFLYHHCNPVILYSLLVILSRSVWFAKNTTRLSTR